MDPAKLSAASCDNLAAMQSLMACRHVLDTPSYLAAGIECTYGNFPSENALVSSIGNIKPLPASSASTVIFGKRKRTGDHSHADDAFDDILVPRPNKQLKPAPVGDARLACPFFKNDFIRHHDCMHAAYQTWSHVKQHLRRKHLSESCGRPSADKPDVNCDSGVNKWCISEDKHLLDNIEDARMKLIDEKTKARMPDNVRWNVAWGIIFPQITPPKTPYAQDIIDEFEDHAIRHIASSEQSSPAELVASLLEPRAVVTQFFQLLREAYQLSTPYDRVVLQHEASKGVTACTSTNADNGLTNRCNHEKSHQDNLMATALDGDALTRAGIIDVSIHEEPPVIQHLFCGQNLWEGLG